MTEKNSKVATFVKDVSRNFAGKAELFAVDPPLGGNSHVVVSAVDDQRYSFPICETYIFGATAQGEIADWGELEGSYKDGTDIDVALEGAGYEVVR